MGMFWLNILLIIGNGWLYIENYNEGDTLLALLASVGVAAGLFGAGASLRRLKLRGRDD